MAVDVKIYYSISGSFLNHTTSKQKPFEKQCALKTLEQIEQAKGLTRTFGDDKTVIKTHAVATEIYKKYESRWCFICRLWDNIKQLFVTTERRKVYDVYQKILKQTNQEIPLYSEPAPTPEPKPKEPEPKVEPKPVEPEPIPEPEISIPQETLDHLVEKLKFYVEKKCIGEIDGDFLRFEFKPEVADAVILQVSNKLLDEGCIGHIPYLRTKIKSEKKLFEYCEKVVDHYCSKGQYKEAYDNAWYIVDQSLRQKTYKKICEHSWKNKKFDRAV